MLRFTEYTDIENYIESLLEYTIANHPTGSYVTWGISNGKPNIASWITTGFANTAIPLSDTTVFQLVDGKPEDFEDNYIIGTSKKITVSLASANVISQSILNLFALSGKLRINSPLKHLVAVATSEKCLLVTIFISIVIIRLPI